MKAAKAVEIPCQTCKGTGVSTLKPSLAITFARFARGSRLTATQVFLQGAEGKTVNAVNNRLEQLRALGLLERNRVGRAWEYSRPAKKD